MKYKLLMTYWDGQTQRGEFNTLAEALAFVGRETTVVISVQIDRTLDRNCLGGELPESEWSDA